MGTSGGSGVACSTTATAARSAEIRAAELLAAVTGSTAKGCDGNRDQEMTTSCCNRSGTGAPTEKVVAGSCPRTTGHKAGTLVAAE